MSLTNEVDVTPAFHPPELPSKWDIIPIHNSDRANFKRCRRYWDWNSPARHNLNLRADQHGVNKDLWFGTGIHWALEQFYTPGLSRDPVEAWKTWYDIQWRGGIVTTDWLDKIYDLKPRKLNQAEAEARNIENTEGYWLVRGLEDILPDSQIATGEFDELYELGVQMMTFYREYAEKHDDFEVVLVEHDFSIPVWDYANDRILTAIDSRENSPNYGKELEVHNRGRVDNLYRRLDDAGNHRYGIIDYKTAAKIDEDYFEKLDTDEQCTSYLYAIEVEGNYYNLPTKGKPVEEVLYTALRKAYPKPPTILQSGLFSVDRTKESTTYAMLMETFGPHLKYVQLTEKQQNYIDWLKDVGDEQFIIRKTARRNRHQIASAGERLYLESLDMLATPNIYPNISNDFRCMRCQFRPPCIAKEDGGDWQQLLRDNYSSARDR
jgi:hypothetical protein